MRDKPKPSLILAGVVAVVGLSATAAFATITSPIDPAGGVTAVLTTDLAESPVRLPKRATPADDAASPATVPAAEPVATPVRAQPVKAAPAVAKPVAVPVAAAPVKARVKAAPVKAAPATPEPVKADPTKVSGKDCNHDGKADDLASAKAARWQDGAGHANAQRAQQTARHDRSGRHDVNNGNRRSNGTPEKGGHH